MSMPDAAFAALEAELDRWGAAGHAATFWWRDDDAAEDTPALARLFALAARAALPLGLAVVPARMTPGFLRALAAAPAGVAVLQHGYAHQNFGGTAEKKVELGPHRPGMIVLGELATGKLALEQRAGGRFLPVLVPPWNRIAPALVPALPELGYRGLSQFAPRRRREPVKGLVQANCHCDIVDWKGTRGFVGTEAALDMIIAHLRLRRQAHDLHQEALAGEPTGIMTHHMAHDEECWMFLDALFDRLSRHPSARILDAAAVFGA